MNVYAMLLIFLQRNIYVGWLE